MDTETFGLPATLSQSPVLETEVKPKVQNGGDITESESDEIYRQKYLKYKAKYLLEKAKRMK